MDKQTSRQGKCRMIAIPGTQWALVRAKDVDRLEMSNQVKGETIKRQLVELGEPDDGTGISVTVGDAYIRAVR